MTSTTNQFESRITSPGSDFATPSSRLIESYVQSETVNPFLLTTIEPDCTVKSAIYDDDVTPSVLKTLTGSFSFLTFGTNAFLLRINPHRIINPIALYSFDPASGSYNYLQNVPLPEDLSQNFFKVRLVSGMTQVQCATIASGLFSVAGTINAIGTGQLPDLQSTDFNSLLQYKRNDQSIAAGVPVADGCVAIASPDEETFYRIPQTTAVYNSDRFLNISNPNTNYSLPWSPSNGGTLPNGFVFYQASTVPGLIPINLFGFVKINANIKVGTQGTGSATVNLIVVTATADPVTGLRVFTQTTFPSLRSIVAGQDYDFHFNVAQRFEATITDIIINYTTGTAVNSWVGAFPDQWVNIEAPEYYARGFANPGSLIAFSGTSTGSQMVIKMVFNYEVVPNENLIKNVPTKSSEVGHFLDMWVAKQTLAHSDSAGIKFIYPLSEYYIMKNSKAFYRIATRSVASQHAASMMDFLMPIGRFFGGLGKAILPAALGFIGSAFSPSSNQQQAASVYRNNMQNAASVYGYHAASEDEIHHASTIPIGVPLRIRTEDLNDFTSNDDQMSASGCPTELKQEQFTPLETKVLQYFRDNPGKGFTALQLAKSCTTSAKPTKKDINPTLYALMRRNFLDMHVENDKPMWFGVVVETLKPVAKDSLVYQQPMLMCSVPDDNFEDIVTLLGSSRYDANIIHFPYKSKINRGVCIEFQGCSVLFGPTIKDLGPIFYKTLKIEKNTGSSMCISRIDDKWDKHNIILDILNEKYGPLDEVFKEGLNDGDIQHASSGALASMTGLLEEATRLGGELSQSQGEKVNPKILMTPEHAKLLASLTTTEQADDALDRQLITKEEYELVLGDIMSSMGGQGMPAGHMTQAGQPALPPAGYIIGGGKMTPIALPTTHTTTTTTVESSGPSTQPAEYVSTTKPNVEQSYPIPEVTQAVSIPILKVKTYEGDVTTPPVSFTERVKEFKNNVGQAIAETKMGVNGSGRTALMAFNVAKFIAVGATRTLIRSIAVSTVPLKYEQYSIAYNGFQVQGGQNSQIVWLDARIVGNEALHSITNAVATSGRGDKDLYFTLYDNAKTRVDGGSMGLATMIALAGIKSEVAFSGVVSEGGMITSVSSVAEKVDFLYSGNAEYRLGLIVASQDEASTVRWPIASAKELAFGRLSGEAAVLMPAADISKLMPYFMLAVQYDSNGYKTTAKTQMAAKAQKEAVDIRQSVEEQAKKLSDTEKDNFLRDVIARQADYYNLLLAAGVDSGEVAKNEIKARTIARVLRVKDEIFALTQLYQQYEALIAKTKKKSLLPSDVAVDSKMSELKQAHPKYFADDMRSRPFRAWLKNNGFAGLDQMVAQMVVPWENRKAAEKAGTLKPKKKKGESNYFTNLDANAKKAREQVALLSKYGAPTGTNI